MTWTVIWQDVKAFLNYAVTSDDKVIGVAKLRVCYDFSVEIKKSMKLKAYKQWNVENRQKYQKLSDNTQFEE